VSLDVARARTRSIILAAIMDVMPLTPAEKRETFDRLLTRACEGEAPPTESGLSSDVIEALSTIARGPGAPSSLVDAARLMFEESVR
jgi:hypothetical protein